MMSQYVTVEDLDKIVRAFNERLVSLETSDIGAGLGDGVAFTPALTQGVTAVTSTPSNTYYWRVGRHLVLYTMMLSVTSAGVLGGAITVTLPGTMPQIAGFGNYVAGGAYTYYDSGTNLYTGSVYLPSSSVMQFISHKEGNLLGVSPNIACASGDALMVAGHYRY
jgi:hypothetical protein